MDYVQSLHSAEISSVMFTGDFNLNLLDTELDVAVMDFCNLTYSHFLFPTISKPSRVAQTSATLIDNIFVNNPLSTFSGILYCDYSDHFPIFQLFLCNLVGQSRNLSR